MKSTCCCPVDGSHRGQEALSQYWDQDRRVETFVLEVVAVCGEATKEAASAGAQRRAREAGRGVKLLKGWS